MNLFSESKLDIKNDRRPFGKNLRRVWIFPEVNALYHLNFAIISLQRKKRVKEKSYFSRISQN